MKIMVYNALKKIKAFDNKTLCYSLFNEAEWAVRVEILMSKHLSESINLVYTWRTKLGLFY